MYSQVTSPTYWQYPSNTQYTFSANQAVPRVPGVPSAFQPRTTPTSYATPVQWPTTTWMQQPPPSTQVMVSQPRVKKTDRVVETLLRIIPSLVKAIMSELQPRREILGPPREVPLTRPDTAGTIIYETHWQKAEAETVVPTLSTQAMGSSPQPMPRALSTSESSDEPELKITVPPASSEPGVLVTPLTMQEGSTPWPTSSISARSPVRTARPCSNCGHVTSGK